MKELFRVLKNHFKEDFHPGLYAYTAAFILICTLINYRFNLEDYLAFHFLNSTTGLFYWFLAYSFCYFSIAVPVLIIQGKKATLRNTEFWIKTIALLLFLSVERNYSIFNLLTSEVEDPNKRYFLIKVLPNLNSVVYLLAPILVLKLMYDKNDKGIYGIRTGNLVLKPFLPVFVVVLIIVMLGVMLPGFTDAYPVFNYRMPVPVFHLGHLGMGLIFIIAYSLDFLMIELLYRGGFVLGMNRLMGKSAVLPMITLYVFIHFGKPMPEALSSAIGGYVLAVFALHYKNILPGAFLHIFLALSMELAAGLVLFFF